MTNSCAIALALAVAPEPWLSDDLYAQQCSMVCAVVVLLNGFDFEVIVDNVAPRASAGSSRGFQPRTNY